MHFLVYSLPCAAFLGSAISYEKISLFHVLAMIAGTYILFNFRLFSFKEILIPENYFFLLSPLWFLLSFLWSESLPMAIRFELQLFTGLACFFGVQLLINTPEKMANLLKLLFILFVFHLIISLLEAYTSFRLPVSPMSSLVKSIRSDQWVQNLNYPSYYSHYPTSFFWHPNNVALVTLCALPLIFNSKIKIIFKIFIWLASLTIILKAGAKAMFILFCIYTLTIIFRTIHKINKLKVIILPILLVASVSGMIFWRTLHEAQKKEIRESFITVGRYVTILPKFITNQFFGTSHKIEFHGNTKERFIFMAAAINEYKKSPFLGIGAGQLYKDVNWKGQKVNLTSIHNYWLEMFVLGGPLYIILYLLWFCFLIIRLRRKKISSAHSLSESLVLFFFAAPVMSSAFYFLPKWLLYGLSVQTLKLDTEPANEHLT